MDNILARHRNATALVIALFVQILALAVQVKRADPARPGQSMPLIRIWVVSVLTPIEKAVVNTGHAARNTWSGYVALRGVHEQNRELKAQIERLRIAQVRLQEDAAAARRLQALLKFKEQYIARTVAAQVIGSSGSDQSRVVYIDKGSNDGVQPDMAVITPEGVVGKVMRALPASAQVLLITDPSWGVGAILEKSRLQGIVKGTASGDLQLANILSDEKVEPGERVLTSGGDRVFPKGLPLGTVAELLPRTDLFLNIRLTPAARISRLEEVLIITQVDERAPAAAELPAARAADVLAQRLPSVSKPEPAAEKSTPGGQPAARPKPAPAANPAQQQAPPKPAETRPEATTVGDNPR